MLAKHNFLGRTFCDRVLLTVHCQYDFRNSGLPIDRLIVLHPYCELILQYTIGLLDQALTLCITGTSINNLILY